MMMTSADYENVEVFSAGISELRGSISDLKLAIDGRFVQLERKVDELKAEVQVLDKNVAVNSAKMDMLQHYQTLGFTILTVVIALVGFVITLAPMFREMYRDARKDKKPEISEARLQEMIEATVSKVLKRG